MSPLLAEVVTGFDSDFVDPTQAESSASPALHGIENLDLTPLLHDRRLKGLQLEGSTVGGGLTRTVEGASTLTVNILDPDWVLLNSGLLDTDGSGRFITPLELQLDELWFRVVKVAPQPPLLTLTLIEREVALLQEATKKVVVSRKKSTFAEFGHRLIRSVKDDKHHLRCYIPELHQRQAIAKVKTGSSRRSKDAARQQGLPTGMQLTQWDGSEHTLTSGETHNAETALQAADDHSAPQKATLALLCACIVEAPMFANPTSSDGTSVGILQLLNTHLGGSSSTKGGRRDVSKVCGLFLTQGFAGAGGAIALARKHPDWTPGEIAQAVQGSAHPGRYDEVRHSAQRVLSAWSGGGGRPDGSRDNTVVKPYLYKVTGNYWKTLSGYAQPINWRLFVVNGVVYLISEERLFLSRPRATISRDHPAVIDLGFSEWDTRKEVSELTVQTRASLWAFPPGCVLLVDHSGPFDGGWLVHTIDRQDLADQAVTVTLNKPLLKKAEPAPQTESGSTIQAGGGAITLGSSIDGRLKAAVQEMQRIDKQNYHYVYGGGHASFAGPYDCSGAVSAVLHAAHLLDTPQSTSGLINWGRRGEGEHMTVWVHETGVGQTSHTFITVRFGGRTVYFEAGGADSAHTGFHKPRPTAGFTPRHWPGL